jgi:hypothetical protein
MTIDQFITALHAALQEKLREQQVSVGEAIRWVIEAVERNPYYKDMQNTRIPVEMGPHAIAVAVVDTQLLAHPDED